MLRRVLSLSLVFVCRGAVAQPSAPNVSQVVAYSTVVPGLRIQAAPGSSSVSNPAGTGTVPNAVLSVYTENVSSSNINIPQTYVVANPVALSSVVSSNIAVALSTLIPVSSPASAVTEMKDPATGALLPSSDTDLGPIFTERADVIGQGRFHVGITHQDLHFTSLDGHSLNGMNIIYSGGNPSKGLNANTLPATYNLGLDVRLSQTLAFFTYGLTNRVEVSAGIPMIHASVASTAYNGMIYSGAGDGSANGQCWCINTFTPGAFNLTMPFIGQARGSKTGMGDVLLRVKGAAMARHNFLMSLGGDLRLPTGDAENYLGTGATSVKPFAAVSLLTNPSVNGVVISPHANVGWQFSGRSVLGGLLQPTLQTGQISSGSLQYASTPFTVPTHDYLPDVFSWGVGLEAALGRRNTIVVDFLGNQVGWVHGAETLKYVTQMGLAPNLPGATVSATPYSGFVSVGKTSFGQYSSAFGYKARLAGNLVATVNLLVRLDNNGLTARLVPLYGLSYSFGAGR